MKSTFVIFLISTIIACNNKQENITPRPGLYKNGIISTGSISNSGVAAPAGYTWSESQHNTGNSTVTNTAKGFASYYNAFSSYKLTDDFIIPAGETWDISSISVYVFGDNYNGTTPPVDTLKLMIWNGHPKFTTSSLVYGDSLNNRLTASLDTLCFVIQNSAVPPPGITPVANTKIWKLTANISKRLSAGTYWLAWQTHDINGGADYSPAAKIKGSRNVPGWNAAVYNSFRVWQDIIDYGNPGVGVNPAPQDLPFEIVYTY